MTLTYGKIITALVLIGFSFFIMQTIPSGDCAKLYNGQDKIKSCNDLQIIGSVMAIMTVVIVILIIINGVLSNPEDKIERPWGALPKGYEKQSKPEVEQE